MVAPNDEHLFAHLKNTVTIGTETYHFYDPTKLEDVRYQQLPYSIRVLLEQAIRNCDGFQIKVDTVETILNWYLTQHEEVEVPFKPARVLLQDFTGVPVVVDFAAMRDAFSILGGDANRVNPMCPTDLVIDHSVQVDFTRTAEVVKHRSLIGDCFECQSTGVCEVLRMVGSKGLCKMKDKKKVTMTSTSGQSSPLPPVYSVSSSLPWSFQQSSSKRTSSTSSSPSPSSSSSSSSSSKLPSGCCKDWRAGPRLISPSKSPISIIKGRASNKVTISPIEEIDRGFPCPCPMIVYDATTDEGDHGDPEQKGRHFFLSMATPSKLMCETCPFHQLRLCGADSFAQNMNCEFERNRERFAFLKWGSQCLENVTIIPPGSGIVHQVNLEFLARVVFNQNNHLWPDSLVGADSHTTMINGLGILGWGVGGIEAEAVMLGQAISMVLPPVVGYRLTGKVPSLVTSTDVVLTITKHLRSEGVVGSFVEFFGPGVAQLSIADRATIANMCPEYGATVAFFPVDGKSLLYLEQTGRLKANIQIIEQYLKAIKLFRNDFNDLKEDPTFSKTLELDLSTIVSSCSGPKRPQDRVAVTDMKLDFASCLTNKTGFKGYGLSGDEVRKQVPLVFEGKEFVLSHGSVVIAAITSCTNTSNPSVMLGAGLLAQAAVKRGLSVAPYVKTSMSPGSGVVTSYLRESGVDVYLQQLGFDIVGYGCMTCIGNSGPLPDPLVEAIETNDLVAVSVLSGNRNFEGRVHPNTRANYLASPLLVVAYALAGTVLIDFETEPIGVDQEGNHVFLRDLWPSKEDIELVENTCVLPNMFQQTYGAVTKGNHKWNSLEATPSLLYPWEEGSTYIKRPPFFEGMVPELPDVSQGIRSARVLLNLGDSVTTDHISPAGSIARNSPAASFLNSFGIEGKDYNSYGSRRGNDSVMARGTFANTRLVNKLVSKPGSKTVHIPSNEELSVFEAAERYQSEKTPLIIIAGKEYGCGSSRDWAAKGPLLLGVKAVIAESYERIHRSNLIGMGLIPLQFLNGQNAQSLELNGRETFNIEIPSEITPKMTTTVTTGDGKSFQVIMRFDTDVELQYFKNGGILQYTLRQMLQKV